MKPCIGILAPLVTEEEFHRDYLVRMGDAGMELTLKRLRELIAAGYDPKHVRGGSTWSVNAAAASGYYLEGVLRAHGYDTVLLAGVDGEAMETLAQATPLAVCISTSMIASGEQLRRIVRQVRYHLPGVFIIAGGPLVWKSNAWAKTNALEHGRSAKASAPADDSRLLFTSGAADLGVDAFVVSQHGIRSLLEILATLDRARFQELERIPNLALPGPSGTYGFTPVAEDALDVNVDGTRWDLVEKLPALVPITTSVGCAYRCEYCDFCNLYPQLRLRNIDALRRELAMVAARQRADGVMGVYLVDDNVFASPARLREVAEAMRDAKIGVGWNSFVRAFHPKPEVMSLLKASRFNLALMGVESGDQGQLDRMNKRQKADKVAACIRALDANEVQTLMTMLVGFPGETEETLANTIAYLNGLDTDHAMYQVYPLCVVPMSGLSLPPGREKWRLAGLWERWSHATMDSRHAEQACWHVFRGVTDVSYMYYDESTFYNMRWERTVRRRLFRLRQKLTVSLIESHPWEDVQAIFRDMAETMGLDAPPAPPALGSELRVWASAPEA